MSFDISKVHTVFSTEGLKIGSRGYFADTLEEAASLERGNTGKELHTLTGIDLEQLDCFTDEKHNTHRFFYFVEDPMEPVEVTAEEWDNRPRIMKVWDDDYSKAQEYEVLTVRRVGGWNCPVVAMDKTGNIGSFKHCAELEPVKEAKEPEAEKHYRPYNNADEFIEDYKKRFCPDCKGIPAIWVKNVADTLKMVNNIADNEVFMTAWINYSAFMDTYTYPDGTHCGMEE